MRARWRGPRARHSALTLGLIGLIVAVAPALWVSLFTSDPGVTQAAYSYFAWAGPAFGFFGLGTALYFASQGAAKVGGPVLAGTGRLLLVALGGWFLVSIEAPAWTLFALVGAGDGAVRPWRGSRGPPDALGLRLRNHRKWLSLPSLFLGQRGQKLIQRPLPANFAAGLRLEAFSRHLDSQRLAFAAYFPAPTLGMLSAPGCEQIVIIVGHCGSRLIGSAAGVLRIQVKDLRFCANGRRRCRRSAVSTVARLTPSPSARWPPRHSRRARRR